MPYRTPDSKMRRAWDRLKRLFQRTPEPPEDPYAYAMAPLKRGPKGRSGAAVAEIEDAEFNNYSPRG